jgi:hypothetical protein
MMWTLAVVGMQGRTNFGGTLLKWALHCLEGNAAALVQGAGIGTGSAAFATMAGMSWHHVPKDDAWKQAHSTKLVRLGKTHCDDCWHGRSAKYSS